MAVEADVIDTEGGPAQKKIIKGKDSERTRLKKCGMRTSN